MRRFWLLTLSLFLGAAVTGRAAEADTDLVQAEKTLKEANIATDGSALLEFFRKRTLSDADRAKLPGTIRLLGDNSYKVREKATEQLIAAGRPALRLLRSAEMDSNPEIA